MPLANPYKAFHFRVKWDGQYIAGVDKISGLIQRVKLVEFREGGEPDTVRYVSGKTSYDEITLERGLTDDQAFFQWAKSGRDAESIKDIVIELLDEAGQTVLSWILFRCRVVKYEGPELNAKSNEVAIEKLTLAYDGFDLEQA